LVGGEAIPAHRFRIVLRDPAAIQVHVPEVELRLSIPRFSPRPKFLCGLGPGHRAPRRHQTHRDEQRCDVAEIPSHRVKPTASPLRVQWLFVSGHHLAYTVPTFRAFEPESTRPSTTKTRTQTEDKTGIAWDNQTKRGKMLVFWIGHGVGSGSRGRRFKSSRPDHFANVFAHFGIFWKNTDPRPAPGQHRAKIAASTRPPVCRIERPIQARSKLAAVTAIIANSAVNSG